MIDTYSRGNVTLIVEKAAGVDKVTFAIIRTAPLTDTEVNTSIPSSLITQLLTEAATRSSTWQGLPRFWRGPVLEIATQAWR